MDNNIENNQNIVTPIEPKKKGNKGLIVFLILIILGLCGYITYDKVLKDKLFTKEEPKKTEKKKEDNTINDNKQTEEYKIEISDDHDHYVKKEHKTKLNGNDVQVVNVYYYDDTVNEMDEYDLYTETFVNGKKVIDKYQVTFYENKNEANDRINRIENEFKLSTIKDNSNDDNYLVIDHISEGYSCTGKEYYIVDKNGKLITDIRYVDGCGSSSITFNSKTEAENNVVSEAISLVEGKYRAFYDQKAYIVNNVIYYTEPYDCEDVEYHKIVIENGKTKDTKIKTYTGDMANIAGAC